MDSSDAANLSSLHQEKKKDQRKSNGVKCYRKVNEKKIDDKYPIPNINDILDKLGRYQYFSTLDLASGFCQNEMAKAKKNGRKLRSMSSTVTMSS